MHFEVEGGLSLALEKNICGLSGQLQNIICINWYTNIIQQAVFSTERRYWILIDSDLWKTLQEPTIK